MSRSSTRPARSGASRWVAYAVLVLGGAWLATQAFYFAQFACWAVVDPASTAFMRAAAWRLSGARPPAAIDHRWVPYAQISPNLKRAVVASEDADFAHNDGYEFGAIRQAWQRNLRAGRIVEGGSTISQQLARNLFLSPQRSYVRKGQELIITWMLETLLSKQRILEIYLNSVEFGRGVYGAQAAAYHYYGVPANQLGAAQAARLAVMLPAPKYFDAHRGSGYLARRTGVILRRMGDVQVP